MNTVRTEDVRRIAYLHYNGLGDGIVAKLGLQYLIVFYKYVVNSKKEEVFFIRDELLIIQAACIVTYSPKDLFRRTLFHTLIPISYFSMVNIFKSVDFIRTFFKVLKSSVNCRKKVFYSPQIMFIFTNESVRGKGYGRSLLKIMSETLLKKNYKEIYVKTLAGENNPALKFYEKNDFHAVEQQNFAGLKYFYLKKKL
jgi:GNAT superfamily N-acetyltransferase